MIGMKKYLFGLGAMLIGAGLMFVLMHGEVRADQVFKEPTMDKKGILSTEADCQLFRSKHYGLTEYCKIKDLTCVTFFQGVSCVKS